MASDNMVKRDRGWRRDRRALGLPAISTSGETNTNGGVDRIFTQSDYDD